MAAPQQLAVLLPLSGPLAKAGQVVRDGIVAAMYTRLDQNYQPDVRFYDTPSVQVVVQRYRQAVDDGAQMVIGPLDKEQIKTLVAAGLADVPTLALNQIEEHASNLFQFGLAPEDEARSAAQQAYRTGHRRALTLGPDDERGVRVLEAFRTEWLRLGGAVMAHAVLAAEEKNYGALLRKLLSSDAGAQRAKALSAYLKRSLQFDHSHRQDADMLFIYATPVQGRQIMPHLRYLNAADLSVYATAGVYSGKPDPANDRDLNNLIFCDVPWSVQDDTAQPLRGLINELWPDVPESYRRLYALGVDAFGLAHWLESWRRTPDQSLRGVSGELTLHAQNRLQRRLPCATFADGRVVDVITP